jgi:hypothetical protein
MFVCFQTGLISVPKTFSIAGQLAHCGNRVGLRRRWLLNRQGEDQRNGSNICQEALWILEDQETEEETRKGPWS